ncbi:MAG: PD-(D/E)XK nuclease-like domain-containing protein [Verrucomicrobiota bacterium]
MKSKIKEPGIYYDVSYEEYDKIEAFRSTDLKTACIHGLKAFRRNELQKRPPSYALDFGRAMHACMERGERPFIIQATEVTPYCKSWTALQKNNPDAIIVKPGDLELIQELVKALAAHPRSGAMVESTEYTEVTLLWKCPVTGEMIKSRIDSLCSLTSATDWKTTDNVQEINIRRAIAKFGYDIQQAMIRDGLHQLGESHRREFYNVFIEKERVMPDIAIYQFNTAELNDGSRKYREAIEAIKKAREANEWPGLHSNVITGLEGFDDSFSFGGAA